MDRRAILVCSPQLANNALQTDGPMRNAANCSLRSLAATY